MPMFHNCVAVFSAEEAAQVSEHGFLLVLYNTSAVPIHALFHSLQQVLQFLEKACRFFLKGSSSVRGEMFLGLAIAALSSSVLQL